MNFQKLRIPLIILSAILAIVTGWMMYSRTQVEELWSYLPLFFFSGLWAAVVLGLSIRGEQANKRYALLGLSTLSGVILALGFPPIPLTSLMFVAFVPLLLVEQQISDAREGTSGWRVFKYSYHTFVVWNILATYWVANTAFFAGIFAIWVNSLLMAIPFVLYHFVKKRMPNLGPHAFVAFWLSFEYLHLYHQLSWPWLTLGNSLAGFPSWIQWYEYTGVFGGSFWILLGNVFFLEIGSKYYFHKIKFTLKSIVKPFALILIPILISFGIYFTYEEAGEELEVVVVQPNFEPHYGRDKFNKADQYKYYTKLSFDHATKETDYIIYPESSFSSLDEKGIAQNRLITDLKGFLKNYPKASLVMGTGSYRFFEEGEALTPYAREYKDRRTNTTLYYEAYNSAFQLSNGSDDVQIYHKSLLVPGAEFFPYKNIFPFMKPLVDKLGGSVAGLGKQAERSAFTSTNGTRIAPVICYESVYGEYTTGYVRNGAEALFIMTNDGWWDNTAGYKQHMEYARLRAIETRRSIARSANTGISGFINQRGDIIAATNYDEPIGLNGKIRANKKFTIYTRYGDLIARLSLVLSALLLLNLIAKTWLKKVKREKE